MIADVILAAMICNDYSFNLLLVGKTRLFRSLIRALGCIEGTK